MGMVLQQKFLWPIHPPCFSPFLPTPHITDSHFSGALRFNQLHAPAVHISLSIRKQAYLREPFLHLPATGDKGSTNLHPESCYVSIFPLASVITAFLKRISKPFLSKGTSNLPVTYNTTVPESVSHVILLLFTAPLWRDCSVTKRWKGWSCHWGPGLRMSVGG